MPKSSNQVIIDFIVLCLEKGEQRNSILAKVGKKWQTSARTFDRLLKTASEQHKATQDSIKKAKAAIDIQNGIIQRKGQIADVNERKAILSKIIRGQLKINKKVSDFSERRYAIAELNKMEGDYAPDKVANVTADGQDVAPVQLLSDNQFAQLLKTINETSTR